ncbi:MAG: flagellar hook-basal body complex protein FliE [Bacillota bacterium]
MIEPIGSNLNMLSLGENKIEEKDRNPFEDFGELVKENLNQVNQLEKNADELTTNFALGETDDIHQVTIATEKARMALNMTLGVQNRLVKAYEEVMRMQI